MQGNGRTLMVLMLLSAAIIASGCGNTGTATQSIEPSKSPDSSVELTFTAADPSGGTRYLDGAYSVTFNITHSSQECLLSVFARRDGSPNITIYDDVYRWDSSTATVYRNRFEWTDAQFSGEYYTIVSKSTCDEVQIQLLNRDYLAAISPEPSMSIVPTPTPTAESIANGNICSFIRSTVVSRLSSEGSLPYEFGYITLSSLGEVYSDWAKEGTTLLAKNKAATASIIKEVKRLIAIAERTAAAAKAGKSDAAVDLSLTVFDAKIYTLCGGY
jgi:hypothetical protein